MIVPNTMVMATHRDVIHLLIHGDRWQPFRPGGRPFDQNCDGLFWIALDGLCGHARDRSNTPWYGRPPVSLSRGNFFQTATASTSLKTCAATSMAVCCNRVFA